MSAAGAVTLQPGRTLVGLPCRSSSLSVIPIRAGEVLSQNSDSGSLHPIPLFSQGSSYYYNLLNHGRQGGVMLVLAAEKMDRGRGRKENMQRPILMNEKINNHEDELEGKEFGGVQRVY